MRSVLPAPDARRHRTLTRSNVIGRRVEVACRAMLRKDFLPYVSGKRQSSEFGPRRVVLQNPEAGSIPGGPTGVFLFVSDPFPDLLPRDTHRAE